MHALIDQISPVANVVDLIDLPSPPPGKTGWPWTQQSSASVTPAAGPWPKITIVTPSYNQGQYLEETIRSVLLQNYPNLEYIIIDGGSSDNSVEIIRKYEPYLKYWVSEKDNGQAHAINKGFRKATGEWVGWVNSDDYYLPGGLTSLLQEARGTEVEWLAGNIQFVHAGNEEQPSTQTQTTSDRLIDWLVFKFFFHQPGALWKRFLLEQHGYLDEQMHYAFDWAFWCRLIARGVRPRLVDRSVAAFRLHNESKTCTRWDGFCGENERIIRAYLSELNFFDKLTAGRRRTNLICTRLRHESYRLFSANRSRDLLGHLGRAVAQRPHLLLKRTTYALLLECALPQLRKLSPPV